MRNVVLYATDTMADWEYGHLLAGLSMAEEQRPGRHRLLVLGAPGTEHVRTMGGLRVQLDGTVAGVDVTDLAALVLPGAQTWETGHEDVLELAGSCRRNGVSVAAICGATFGLARTGLLDENAHTSNAAEFLTAAPGYSGAHLYREEKVVDDDGLITAPATAPVDFARAVFDRLQVFPAPVVQAWYGLYTTGERRYYDQLTAAEA